MMSATSYANSSKKPRTSRRARYQVVAGALTLGSFYKASVARPNDEAVVFGASGLALPAIILFPSVFSSVFGLRQAPSTASTTGSGLSASENRSWDNTKIG
eukprot:2977282-Pyramimonas_sp.AAC.1